MKETHLRNYVSPLSDKAAVLAARVPVRVRREFRIGANGRLDGNNDIAGEVGNSSHCKESISYLSILMLDMSN